MCPYPSDRVLELVKKQKPEKQDTKKIPKKKASEKHAPKKKSPKKRSKKYKLFMSLPLCLAQQMK